MPTDASSLRLDFAEQRRNMVDRQIRTFDVTNQALLSRMLEAPRERFLPPELESFAYSDASLQVGGSKSETRRALAPMVLARLIQALQPKLSDNALDVAGAGGYGAAILAGLCASVVAVEDIPALTEAAAKAFLDLGISNARALTGRLRDAAGEAGPFDVILIHGLVEAPPSQLLSLLAQGGRLAALCKAETGSHLAMLWTRSGSAFGRRPLFNASGQTLPDFAERPTFAF